MKFNSLNSTYLSDLRLDAEALERKLDYIEHMIYFVILRVYSAVRYFCLEYMDVC